MLGVDETADQRKTSTDTAPPPGGSAHPAGYPIIEGTDFQSVETERQIDFESIHGMPVAQQYHDRAPEVLTVSRDSDHGVRVRH